MGARAGPAQGPLPRPKLLPQSYLGRVSRGNALPKRGTTVSSRAKEPVQTKSPAPSRPDLEAGPLVGSTLRKPWSRLRPDQPYGLGGSAVAVTVRPSLPAGAAAGALAAGAGEAGSAALAALPCFFPLPLALCWPRLARNASIRVTSPRTSGSCRAIT